jgi:hypothetical protein
MMRQNFFAFFRALLWVLLGSSALLFSDKNGSALYGQSTNPMYNADYQWLIERYEIRQRDFSPVYVGAVKPYSREAIGIFVDSLYLKMGQQDSSGRTSKGNFSAADRFNLQYLAIDNRSCSKIGDSTSHSKKAILKHFYKHQNDFFAVRNEHYAQRLEKGRYDFDLHVNPVLHVGIGRDNTQDYLNSINTRGAIVYGTLGRRLGFYTYLAETQAIFPAYVKQVVDSLSLLAVDNMVVPNEGFAKRFNENGVDFLRAQGYIQFKASPFVEVQFGHDKVFIGNGYRSLILSDFAAPHLFLKLQTQFWRLQYTNIFSQMNADVLRASSLYPKKFFALHHISLNITQNLNIGVFESIVYGRRDQSNGSTLELGYLNPFIFYRFVEQGLGSSDNAFLGLDFKWNAIRNIQLYGQAVLDEFVLSEVFGNTGWWGNKQAVQIGAKYIDAFKISNLDLQAEVNWVRPYTYTHFDALNLSNYVHYRQPLAHPLGANFREIIGIVRYQPLARLQITGRAFYIVQGKDGPGENWGSNLLLDNSAVQFTNEYNNKIGQGRATNLLFLRLSASYHLRHNLFLDFEQTIRRSESDLARFTNNAAISQFALRWNIPARNYEW